MQHFCGDKQGVIDLFIQFIVDKVDSSAVLVQVFHLLV